MHLMPCVFLISLSILSLEILLMRIFSITLWHHYAYMIVGLALLGFGASGSFLTLFQKKLKPHFETASFIFIILFAVSIPVSFALSQKIDFNAFHALWQRTEYLDLLLFCFVLFFPFFFGALFLGNVFATHGEKISSLYGANLAGSAAGCVLVVGLMYLMPPVHILMLLSALLCASAAVLNVKRTFRMLICAGVLSVTLAFFLWVSPLSMNISEYKKLSWLMDLPDAKRLKRSFSPLGMLDVIESGAIREAPGMSLAYPGKMPPQAALVIDADSLSPIIKNPNDAQGPGYLDYCTFALVYHLKREPRVLVVGAGGASALCLALKVHDAQKVTALELDPDIITLARETMGENDIYEDPAVNVLIKEARNYLESAKERFDIIDISLIDSFVASSAGVYALAESYLYTRESFNIMFGRLTPAGLFSVTRWIESPPPRETLKLFATAVEALEMEGVSDASKHLLMIRKSPRTVTLIVKRSAFEAREIALAKKFCNERYFDLVYYPGMARSEANRFSKYDEPFFYDACVRVLSPGRSAFYEEYPFFVEPASDNRPYFYHTFKWKCIPVLKKYFGENWLAFAEMGYFVLLAVLAIGIILSVILIVLPLLFLGRGGTTGARRTSRPAALLYFFCIGIGFMFLEMSFFQKFILFLGHPIFSISVILAGFLGFSGLGSFFSKKIFPDERKRILLAVLLIAAVSIVYLVLLGKILALLMSESDALKIIISWLLIAPLAFFMGFPFLSAVSVLERKAGHLIPWAWGVNCCASVISPALATLFAISFGFRVVVCCALVVYLIASAAVFFFRGKAST